MKKRYLILAGMLVMAVAAAGCGKKQGTQETVQTSPTPTPEATKAPEVVNMQTSTEDDITNIMGEKTDTASKVVFVNSTGDDIAAIYVRPHVSDDTDDSDDTWGSDLVNGKFTLKDKDKALYYYNKDQKDSDGKTVTSYDIRVTYTDEEKNECFFRDIPLPTVSQITLCMDTSGDDSIPYAKYLLGSTKKEVSTLNDVKKRLGLTDDSSDSSDDSSSDSETYGTPTPVPNDSSDDQNGGQDDQNGGGNNEDPSPTEAPEEPDTPSDPSNHPSDSDDMISTAEQYIGQSLSALQSACGDPEGSDYEDDPETGKMGLHYYSNFTVSTTVDENGNEIVSGIW